MKILRRVGICAAAGGLMLVVGHAGWGQGAGNVQPPPSMPTAPDITFPQHIEQHQAKVRNLDRQKQLVEDTQKLVALANELKTDVDKSNKDTLSLDVVKKADEIEKLAHSVKEKMKNSGECDVVAAPGC